MSISATSKQQNAISVRITEEQSPCQGERFTKIICSMQGMSVQIRGALIVSAYFLDRISLVSSTAKESLTPSTPLSFFATEPFCDMARASWRPAQFIRHLYEH